MSESENYKFFQHKACEYFPCHATDSSENFNCLFCYCPLYALGEDCGGNFRYTETGIKHCTGCTVPHQRENYGMVTSKVKELIGRVRESHDGAAGNGEEQ